MKLDDATVESFNRTPLPKFLAVEVGYILRMSRSARKLSLAEASDMFKLEVEALKGFERGDEITPLEASYMTYRYGVLVDRVEALLLGWALANAKRTADCKRRNHLSLVGSDSKPWERELNSVDELMKISLQFMNCTHTGRKPQI